MSAYPAWQPSTNAAGVVTGYTSTVPLDKQGVYTNITQTQLDALQTSGAFYNNNGNSVWGDSRNYNVNPADYKPYYVSDPANPVYVAWTPPTTLSSPAGLPQRSYIEDNVATFVDTDPLHGSSSQWATNGAVIRFGTPLLTLTLSAPYHGGARRPGQPRHFNTDPYKHVTVALQTGAPSAPQTHHTTHLYHYGHGP